MAIETTKINMKNEDHSCYCSAGFTRQEWCPRELFHWSWRAHTLRSCGECALGLGGHVSSHSSTRREANLHHIARSQSQTKRYSRSMQHVHYRLSKKSAVEAYKNSGDASKAKRQIQRLPARTAETKNITRWIYVLSSICKNSYGLYEMRSIRFDSENRFGVPEMGMVEFTPQKTAHGWVFKPVQKSQPSTRI